MRALFIMLIRCTAASGGPNLRARGDRLPPGECETSLDEFIGSGFTTLDQFEPV